jgi:hypothetical protein
MEAQSLRGVSRSQRLNWIDGQRGRRWDIGQDPPVRPPEAERAIGLSLDLITLLVDRTMVPSTQQCEVRERGRPAVRPVPHVMPLAQRQPAAGEAAPTVPVMERAPQRRGNRPRSRPDLHDAAVRIVPHHHAARVARQAPRRFRGNVCATLEDGLTGLLRVRQRGRIDVNHDLVSLPRHAGIELMVKRRFRQ